MADPKPSPPLREHVFGLIALLLVVALGAGARIDRALNSEDFDQDSAQGMLFSDPGLLYYLTERVIESGGRVPEDFRADPRIEHPDLVDIPERFTVGQGFLIAWLHRWVRPDLPLHVLCVWVMGIIASLAALGVYGLTFHLTGSARWAALSAVLYGILPANYRTIGFVLVREDLALPLYALHLWLAARTLKKPSTIPALLAGLALGLSMAAWHAMTFVVTLEAFALFLQFLWRGSNPFDRRAGAQVMAGLALPCLLVPALWVKGTILAPGLQFAGALLIVGLFGRHWRHLTRVRAALAALVVLFLASRALGLMLGTVGDFSHVVGVLWAKISNLGLRPENPDLLDFEVRLMWQGPFQTLSPWAAGTYLQVGLVLLPIVLFVDHLRSVKRTGRPEVHVLHILLLLSCIAAWLVERMIVIPGLLLPVALAVTGNRALTDNRSAVPRLGIAALVFFQLVAFGSWLGRHELYWYRSVSPATLVSMLEAVREHVPEDDAVAADFMTSTAILAHTRRPIVLQPKWETAASRERVRAFWEAFHGGTPEELRELLTGTWKCSYLLVDRKNLFWNRDARYLAGLRRDEYSPRTGSAAEALLSVTGDPPQGFQLLWRSNPQAWPDESLVERYRLYRLESLPPQ
ncbi:MAG: hypothetical protein V3T22_06745 [Planctomycetota bacterium]